MWRKVTALSKTNNTKFSLVIIKNTKDRKVDQKGAHAQPDVSATSDAGQTWSDDMISSHLPIYPIASASQEQQLSIPKILFDAISSKVQCVLLGESTHGTSEHYRLRALITKYLVMHKQFTAVFIEMDWPKVYRLNEYISGALDDSDSGSGSSITLDALFDDLKDYPLWMYRNQVVKDLVRWMQRYNLRLRQVHRAREMVALYGIDMQCYQSLKVLKSLYATHKPVLPHAVQIASFLHAIDLHSQQFAERVERAYTESQIAKIYQLFVSTKFRIPAHLHDTLVYNLDQNFATLLSAVHYFSHACAWDIRDRHWFTTMEKYYAYRSGGKYVGYQAALQQQHQQQHACDKGKIVLWAHNSHVCNAAHADYSHSNIGALCKRNYGDEAVFTVCLDTFQGTVTATNHRDEFPQFFTLDANVKESYGQLWHELSQRWHENMFAIFLNSGVHKLQQLRLQVHPKYFVSVEEVKKKKKIRDIGVCYMNQNADNHCSNGNILKLADVVIFVDQSNALEPLQCDKHPNWDINKALWMQQIAQHHSGKCV